MTNPHTDNLLSDTCIVWWQIAGQLDTM